MEGFSLAHSRWRQGVHRKIDVVIPSAARDLQLIHQQFLNHTLKLDACYDSKPRMALDDVVLHTRSSPEACWKRIDSAQSEGSAKVVGYALGSVADVVANGDRFEVHYTDAPVVFTGTLTTTDRGSVIAGRIDVPARRFYAAVVASTAIIGALLLATSAWDLIFGTRHLLTRKATELGPGHPANFEQHIAVFILVPLIVLPVLALFGPKARRPSAEARAAIIDFLHAMFGEASAEASAPKT